MKKLLLAVLTLAVTAAPLALATKIAPEPSDQKPAADRPPHDATTSSGLPNREGAALPEKRVLKKKAAKRQVVKKKTVKKTTTTKDENW